MQINQRWMTTFIYKQDLRSYYMNNILYSLIRPGVYNSNISLSMDTQDILSLHIEKGTTLYFNNDYTEDESSSLENEKPYRRNFTGKSSSARDNNDRVLIKCVANQGMTVNLNVPSNVTSIDSSTPYIKGKDFNKPVYLCAFFYYKSDDSNNQYLEPEFRLVTNNETYGTEGGSKLFYKILSPEGYEDAFKIADNLPIDGVTDLTGDNYYWSYLMLGVINPLGNGKMYLEDRYTLDWFKSHVFTGRGLPEYRYPITIGNNAPSHEIFLGTPNPTNNSVTQPAYKKLYLDISNAMSCGRIYDNHIDWERFYNIGYYNYNFEGNNKYLSLSFDSCKPLLDEHINDITFSESSSCDLVIYDVVFACTHNSISNISESVNFRDSTLKLIYHRCINSEDANIKDKFPLSNIFSDTSNPLYLDICDYNVNKLLDIVKNKDVLSQAIDSLRSSGKLDPSVYGESIIPICIVFRPFKKLSDGTFQAVGLPDEERYLDSIRPENILSYLDLSDKMTELRKLPINSQDAYTILPVIN